MSAINISSDSDCLVHKSKSVAFFNNLAAFPTNVTKPIVKTNYYAKKLDIISDFNQLLPRSDLSNMGLV